MAKDKRKNIIPKTFADLLKEAGEPVKKEGVTVIEKNGRVYVFNYGKKRKK